MKTFFFLKRFLATLIIKYHLAKCSLYVTHQFVGWVCRGENLSRVVVGRCQGMSGWGLSWGSGVSEGGGLAGLGLSRGGFVVVMVCRGEGLSRGWFAVGRGCRGEALTRGGFVWVCVS